MIGVPPPSGGFITPKAIHRLALNQLPLTITTDLVWKTLLHNAPTLCLAGLQTRRDTGPPVPSGFSARLVAGLEPLSGDGDLTVFSLTTLIDFFIFFHTLIINDPTSSRRSTSLAVSTSSKGSGP